VSEREQNGNARILWAVISTLAVVVLALIGFSVSQVTARLSNAEVDIRVNKGAQDQINRDRESRLATLEVVATQVIPEMKVQLDRIERKVDAHMIAK
jgi:hypothetical protein